jgi:hypothetical protein
MKMKPDTPWKRNLYRAIAHSPLDGVVFVSAPSRDHAARKIRNALAVLYNTPPHKVDFDDLASFEDLVSVGVSVDEDLRVFEMSRSGREVTGWTNAPLFLTHDQTLLGKWAELYAGIAFQETRGLINRTR